MGSSSGPAWPCGLALATTSPEIRQTAKAKAMILNFNNFFLPDDRFSP